MANEPDTHRNMPTSLERKNDLPQAHPAASEAPGADVESPKRKVGRCATIGCIISGLMLGLPIGFLGVLGLSLAGFRGSAPQPPPTVPVQEPAQPEVLAQPEFPVLVSGEVYQVERATSLASEYLGEPTQTLPEGGYLRIGDAYLDGFTPWYVVHVSDGIQTYPMWIDAAWLRNQRLVNVPTPPS